MQRITNKNKELQKMDQRKTPAKLNNGLTPEQVSKAREILALVNVTKVCEKSKIKRSVLENVLRGSSKDVEVLKFALIEAKRQRRKQEKTIKALPL